MIRLASLRELPRVNIYSGILFYRGFSGAFIVLKRSANRLEELASHGIVPYPRIIPKDLHRYPDSHNPNSNTPKQNAASLPAADIATVQLDACSDSISIDQQEQNANAPTIDLTDGRFEIWRKHLSNGERALSASNRELNSLHAQSTRNASGVGHVHVRGRIRAIRRQSSKLAFVDIEQDGARLQVVINSKIVHDEQLAASVMKILKSLHTGDVIEVRGAIGKTTTGELSIFAESGVCLLAPCLRDFPREAWTDFDKRFNNRSVDFLCNERARRAILGRHILLNTVRQFLLKRKFVEVETPILANSASGAFARPFRTRASQLLNDARLSLRCAPELWLKQLIVGGFGRVFEIGKVFRNEGCDATHNPEFTSVELYTAFTSISDMMEMTTEMLKNISDAWATAFPELCTKTSSSDHIGSIEHISVVDNSDSKVSNTGPDPENSNDSDRVLANSVWDTLSSGTVQYLDFISTIQSEAGIILPELEETRQCVHKLVEIFQQLGIPQPQVLTTTKLLDKLADKYIIPKCKGITFVVNHPSVMSPLAKSGEYHYQSEQGSVTQRLSHRFEAYLQGTELINAYEEENSPVEQRIKFEQQQEIKRLSGDGEIPDTDSDFLRCLEWGLPPTTGWGLGFDRLLMMLLGEKRIAEVLAFGSLRRTKQSVDVRENCRSNMTVSKQKLEPGNQKLTK